MPIRRNYLHRSFSNGTATLMEKFTKWEDKSNGINPFVEVKPSRSKGKSALAHLLSFLLKAVLVLLFPLRLLLFLAVLTLALLFDFLALLLPFTFLKRAVRRTAVAPTCRLALLLLGYLRIAESIPDHRRLRLGTRVGKDVLASLRFTTVRAGDAVFCNSTNFAEILYLSYRFSPDFALLDLPEGKKVTRVGLLGALQRATWAYRRPAQRATEGRLETIKECAEGARKGSGAPLCVLAEGVRSNGQALLQFGECVNGVLPERTHLLGFKYSFRAFNPCHTAQGFWGYLASSFLYVAHNMAVSYVPHELCSQRQGGEGDRKAGEELRNLLALGIGDRGVKTVALGPKEYFAFLDYYEGDGKKQR